MFARSSQRWFFALALVTTASVARAEATSWVLKPDQSPVTFVATGKPGFLKIRGEGGRIDGTAKVDGTTLNGTFDVTMATFKTGIDLRDEHMHGKYLESAKFPTARLVLDSLTIDPAASDKDYAFTGKLTVKGVEKPVAGKLNLTLAGTSAKGKATFEVKLSDYPVGVPSHLGVSVAETVAIEAEISGEKRTDVASKP